MRAVKGFVLSAIVLLIPTMAYFQKQHFEDRMKPRLRAAVEEVLTEEKVTNPEVEMDYLDALIRGRVDDQQTRRRVATRVNGLPGVRVTERGNQLRYYGWVELSRVGGDFRVRGALPLEYVVPLPSEFGLQAGWDEGLERLVEVEAPEEVSDWRPFLTYYFSEPGDRRVEIRKSGLTMRGDATAGMQSDWTAKASELAGKDRVTDRLTLRASRFHFPGYEPLSMEDSSRRERLREALASVVLAFDGTAEVVTEVLEAQKNKVLAIANAILNAEPRVRYVVGAHPPSEGNVTENGQIARQRAEAVIAMLVEMGVRPEQLELVAFGVTADRSRDNQVEVLIK